MELMRNISIEMAAKTVHGIGAKTVASLKAEGYVTAADLWDEQDDEPHVPRLLLMGESKHWALVKWVMQQMNVSTEGAAQTRCDELSWRR